MIAEIGFVLLCGHVGGKIGAALQTEQPFWTGIIEPTEVGAVITKKGKRYALHIIQEGQNAEVAAGDYPQVLAALQTWERYIVDEGGSITAWAAQNQDRLAEIAQLKESL